MPAVSILESPILAQLPSEPLVLAHRTVSFLRTITPWPGSTMTSVIICPMIRSLTTVVTNSCVAAFESKLSHFMLTIRTCLSAGRMKSILLGLTVLRLLMILLILIRPQRLLQLSPWVAPSSASLTTSITPGSPFDCFLVSAGGVLLSVAVELWNCSDLGWNSQLGVALSVCLFEVIEVHLRSSSALNLNTVCQTFRPRSPVLPLTLLLILAVRLLLALTKKVVSSFSRPCQGCLGRPQWWHWQWASM